MDPREREAREAQQRKRQGLLDRAYERVVGNQLSKLASQKTYTEDDNEAYRRKLEKDREKAAGRKRKAMSAEHEELARTTGLRGDVVALMADDSDGEDSVSRSRKRSKSKKHKKKDRKRRYEEEGRRGSRDCGEGVDDDGSDAGRSNDGDDDRKKRKSHRDHSSDSSDDSRGRRRKTKRKKKKSKKSSSRRSRRDED
mmetsp:Transcript_35632/g.85039  ORF Transcript_35632/g.85039 Transcript_35632/m.85039 type:complete len:197 (-) Transcript_35632:104-694(-)